MIGPGKSIPVTIRHRMNPPAMKKPASHSQMGFFLSFLSDGKKVPCSVISGLFPHNPATDRKKTTTTLTGNCKRGL